MSKKFNLKKLKITKKAVVIVALLILTGVVGWFVPIFIQNYNRSVEETRQKEFNAKKEDAQNLRALGKTDEAIQKADEALKDTSLTDEQRASLYVERGNIPFDKGDYMDAISYFEKAEAISPGYSIVDLLAITWERAGNKEKAIEYYKKTIELMPTDNPMRGENIADLQAAIKRLGGTP